jgi:hypothetical protein
MTTSSSSCAVGEISIHLAQSGQSNFIINLHRGFRLRVVASDACGMDNEIFRYTVVRTDPDTGISEYELSGVCTWADMEAHPVYTPDQEQDPQIVRLAYVDIVVDTEAIAADAWDVMKDEIENLVETIAVGQILAAGESLDISNG